MCVNVFVSDVAVGLQCVCVNVLVSAIVVGLQCMCECVGQCYCSRTTMYV